MTWTLKVVDGDVVRLHTNTGYERVTGTPKLRQDCGMVLSTDIRDSTGIGSSLDSSIGASSGSEPEGNGGLPTMFRFQMLVKDSLERFKYNQRRYLYDQRAPDEVLEDFSPVQIWPVSDDPRNFRWRVEMYTLGNLPNFTLSGVTR